MQVYIIINKITKAFYIGITNGNKKNYFGSGKALYDNIKKYGKTNFRKFTLEFCKDRIIASLREKYWIKYAKEKWNKRHCLNLTDGGENSYTQPQEVRNKISENLIKFYTNNPDAREKYRKLAQKSIVKWTKEHGTANQKIFDTDKINIIYDYVNYIKTETQLSKEYNVSVSCIHRIVNPFLKKKYRGSGNGSAKLNENDVVKIRKEYSINKRPFNDIAKDYGVSYNTISRIINRKNWIHI